jgi:large subunit ribosomal protein L4
MKLKIYPANKANQTVEVEDKIFKVAEKPKLISQVVQSQLANRRQAIAHTKDRGEVSGGGRKPYRQKGTGNARAGSIRSPLWVGGGVVFGPRKNRNYSQRIPRKMAQAAFKMVLSEKVKNNRLIVTRNLQLKEPKTREIQGFLEKLPIEEGRILIALAKTNVNLELASANLPYVKTVMIPGLTLIDLLNYDYLITDKEGLKAIEEKCKS